VTLDAGRLRHITAAHPELDRPELTALLIEAVEEPHEVHYGHGPGEEWLYVRGGPSRWVKVVVVFPADGPGRIITAFPRRKKP
jgi:hypothetical protein